MTDFECDDVTRSEENQPAEIPESPAEIPSSVGRYRIERILGRGGFGTVYLARDDQLDRRVAVKVPHRWLMENQANAETYLTEARTVANLDHPGIVPVFDVGGSVEFPCFYVSKYVEGQDLSDKLKNQRMHFVDSAELTADVAEALHYAHKQGLVHRDVKPGNILLDAENRPFIVDFGLALSEENMDEGLRYAGTPAYMSPEQARGEGHRVDGRSDIFSLGVVLYELLVGKRPFRGQSREEVVEHITKFEPRPPRQFDDDIPKELERICLKALSKRSAERYSTAKDMADDLRYFLSEQAAENRSGHNKESTSDALATSSSADSTTATDGDSLAHPTAHSSDSRLAKIIPKGLRSFDEHDAAFFLELLPGPRDREGLTDSLRFWKCRIEETDADKTFSVGLIYGPSGCGKSSLVKAGLLPRLSEDVVPIYVEATAEETESRLLKGLRKRIAGLDHETDLKQAMIAIRQRHDSNSDRKVLIIIDQFEQWLHARQEQSNTELVAALRQCDGASLQCIVMVRDDFWMAVTRFHRDLEITLVQGENFAPFDLFPIRHARKVLAAFGRAFGALPDRSKDTSDDQKEFLEQAVDGLAEGGKVICVRLALFAEMMKGKSWTPATLEQVGGTEGMGVNFLEETFSAQSNPAHKMHQQAARAVLKALLPDSGTDLKGQMKSHAELLVSSGYERRTGDFEDLINILDGEIRLITPSDPRAMGPGDLDDSQIESGNKYYQLTHDYLVPSLRNWLTRKQKETRQGRAELMLADRSSLWNRKPENRHLPSWSETINIRLSTAAKSWTGRQEKMMDRAVRVHCLRTMIAVGLVVIAIFAGLYVHNRVLEERNIAEASRLVYGLKAADTSRVNAFIQNLEGYRQWANAELKSGYIESPDDTDAKLHAGLALLSEDKSVLPYLTDRLLDVSHFQFKYVRDILGNEPSLDKSRLIEDLWAISLGENEIQDDTRRFRAAVVLATYDPDSVHWQNVELCDFIASQLASSLPSEIYSWQNAMRPVKHDLIGPLRALYRDPDKHEQIRVQAADYLADFVAGEPEELFDLLAESTLYQFPVMLAKLKSYQEQAIALATLEIAREYPDPVSDIIKEQQTRRQANAAIALYKLGASVRVWPLLRYKLDPSVRSYIVHWLSQLGADPVPLIEAYEESTDVSIKRAILLSLGEFERSLLPDAKLQSLLIKVEQEYRDHPDAGLHAAAEWLLRKWGLEERLASPVELQSTKKFPVEKESHRQWYLNSKGQVFVILTAGDVQVGSPESDSEREGNEASRRRRIGRRFAIGSTEVTKAQWTEFAEDVGLSWTPAQKTEKTIPTDDSAMVAMTWYEAAHYCNWLSAQEGLIDEQWCYATNENGEYGPGMIVKENFLELPGYRLPTETEWEFACRAGTSTRRYFGQNESLLNKYARYMGNSDDHVWPVGRLKPNDFGLFDMQGNAYEWCHDVYYDYEQISKVVIDDAPETGSVAETSKRVLRGGGCDFQYQSVRSATRYWYIPTSQYNHNGFRLVKTIEVLE